MKVERIEIFPTSIWCVDLDNEIADFWEPIFLKIINKNMMKEVRPIHQQTFSSLHELKEISKFIGLLKVLVKSEMTNLGYQLEDINITGMWATRLDPGAHHPVHSHPNSWLSGVYYPTSFIGNQGNLMFYDPRPAATVFKANTMFSSNRQISNTFSIYPNKGRIVFFPSWLWHGVNSVHDETRYSVSFDLLPKGMLGSSGVETRIVL